MQDAAEVIATIVSKNPDIARIAVFEPSPFPLIQERISQSGDDKKAIDSALILKIDHGVPFWDALLLSMVKLQHCSIEILEAAAEHNNATRNRTPIERE